MRETSSRSFSTDIESGKVLVDCYATWCGPCEKQKDILLAVEAEHPDVTVVTLDVEKEPDLVSSLGVMSLPTLFLYRSGEPIKKFVGLTAHDKILAAFSD